MSQQQNQSFFDSKTILAIVMVGLVFFGWQHYLNSKYPNYYKKPAATDAVNATAEGKSAAGAASVDNPGEKSAENFGSPAKIPGTTGATGTSEVPEKVLTYQNNQLSFQISSLGMGFKEVVLKDFLDAEKQPLKFLATEKGTLFETRLVGSNNPIPFTLTQKSDHEFEGVSQTAAGVIRKTVKIDPATAKIETLVVVENAPATFPGIALSISKQKQASSGGNFLMPTLDHQEVIFKHNGSIERTHVVDKEEKKITHETASLAAIGSQYFVSGLVDKSEILPSVEAQVPVAGAIEVVLSYKPANIKPVMEFKTVNYIGGKSLGHLQNVDQELTDLVNFGFFALIGKWLLKILIWSHSLVGNWGWAVVIMTVLVRLLVLPFNIASYRSMKKMQLIQPHLQSLRERYKSDPAALNRESMLLMKEHKVNPLGGCLPMLLQMPVFFAFYQVLGQSIELYQSPWILWITDLSQKDPYFVLPVLMGLTMFIQQKITPTTMDPMQAKILMWMPIIFSAFTLALPSGLTLYIFVSTLFGVVQQRIFMRDNTKTKASEAVIEAKAEGRT